MTVTPSTLSGAAASGAKWISGATTVLAVCRLIEVAVLARVLGPREFGIAASALVVVGLATSFADAGLSNAIIAKHTHDRGQLSSLYWANMAAGGALAVALAFSAPLVSRWFGAPELEYLVPLAATGFLLQPIGQQSGVLLQRELRFRALAVVDAVTAILAAIASVSLALVGLGPASIIVGYLVGTTVKSLSLGLLGWSTWRPSFHFRRRDLDGYVSFGAFQVGERLTNYLGANVDYLLIGRFLGPQALGVYAIAYQLVVIPRTRLNPIFMRVAFPLLARLRDDDEALRRGFLQLTRVIAMITFPLLAGLAVVADPFIPVVYGEEFAPSIPILQIEVIVGALFALGNPLGSLFLAKDRPEIGFKLASFRLVTLTLAIGFAVQFGLVAVAWAYVAAIVLQFAIARVVLWRVVQLPPREYFSALRQPTLLTLGMAATVLAATPILKEVAGNDAVLLGLQITVGMACYAGLTALTARAYVRSLFELAFPNRAKASANVRADST